MQQIVCLCLKSLYDSLKNDDVRVRLTYDLWLEKSVQDETEYYDLYSYDGYLIGCDGELYSIIEYGLSSIKLISNDSEKKFILSKKEFGFATMKLCV